MSNQVSIFENNTGVAVSTPRKGALGDVFTAPVNNTRRIQARNTGDFVRIKEGQVVGSPVRDALNVIIVGAIKEVSREYYGSVYDAENPTMPDCWSNKGDVPDPACSNPQSAACATCPQNIQGSGQSGRRACKFQRRIAVMVEGDPKGTVYQFKIPSKSLFGKGVGNTHPFESYVKFLASNGESPDTVVTQIAHDPNNTTQTYVLNFKPVRQVSDEEWGLVLEAQQNPDTYAYVQMVTAQTDGVTTEPPSAQPAAIEYSDEPDEAPAETQQAEPTKRAAKKTEPKPVAGKLADVVSAWSDDD